MFCALWIFASQALRIHPKWPGAARVQQATIIVLAVQFQQGFGQGPQNFARTTAVVDPSGLAPVSCVDPPQDQLVAARQSGFLQHAVRGMSFGQIKPRRHFTVVCTLANQISTTAPSKHKTQRIQQDRLACTGFTRQHIQTGLKRKFQPVNDQHV